MIQVCARCGTQWNVRGQRRYWCPRCRGTLLEPGAKLPARPAAAAALPPGRYWVPPNQLGRPATPSPQRPRTPARLPAGYRWIAVRPGSPPAPPRRRRPLGPTPRYPQIPQWGLVDHVEPAGTSGHGIAGGRVSEETLNRVLVATVVSLAIASGTHLLRYLLMIVNRGALLPKFIAVTSDWLVYLSVAAAAVTVVGAALCLTDWLVTRRTESYRAIGHVDPRSRRQLRLGCLVPIVNLVYPPIFLLELARIESRWTRQRKAIVTWWALWVATTTLVLVTWICRDHATVQGIADNALFTSLDYAVAAVAAWALWRVYRGFVAPEGDYHRSVRWLPVEAPSRADPSGPASGVPDATRDGNSAVPVEPGGQEPAALGRERVIGAW